MSPHVRFAETAFPGLVTQTPVHTPTAVPSQPPTSENDFDLQYDPQPQAEDKEELAQTGNIGGDDADEGKIADRILQQRRQPAAVIAPDLLNAPTEPFVT
eukprot:2440610-Pleurochrysis_carterae.AAC.7